MTLQIQILSANAKLIVPLLIFNKLRKIQEIKTTMHLELVTALA